MYKRQVPVLVREEAQGLKALRQMQAGLEEVRARVEGDTCLLYTSPRLLAILCTGIGMSVAGLIMQQLCSNKFVSPTTGATISIFYTIIYIICSKHILYYFIFIYPSSSFFYCKFCKFHMMF